MMQKRKLGNSDLELTVVGFGAWALGGAWKYGWGPQDDDESVAAIKSAIDNGINWIDTAPVYGFGRSEEVVGHAIQGRHDDVIIATKCGLVKGDDGGPQGHLKADSVRKECEDSLRRLKVDVIDLYQIHWPNPDEDIEEAWEEIAKLKKEGKIRWAGVSNFNVEQLERAEKIMPVTSLQPPYSMLRRAIEDDILPKCRASNIGVVAYSPMQSGLLTGKVTKEWAAQLPDGDFRKNTKEFNEPNLDVNIAFVEKLKAIAERHGVETGQVAVAWVLRDEVLTSAIVGARRPDQVEKNVKAAGVQLSEDDVAEIQSLLDERDANLKAAGAE
jgi:aryl-alcohol dehydrogenase-like predicted oxidoreductase